MTRSAGAPYPAVAAGSPGSADDDVEPDAPLPASTADRDHGLPDGYRDCRPRTSAGPAHGPEGRARPDVAPPLPRAREGPTGTRPAGRPDHRHLTVRTTIAGRRVTVNPETGERWVLCLLSADLSFHPVPTPLPTDHPIDVYRYSHCQHLPVPGTLIHDVETENQGRPDSGAIALACRCGSAVTGGVRRDERGAIFGGPDRPRL